MSAVHLCKKTQATMIRPTDRWLVILW